MTKSQNRDRLKTYLKTRMRSQVTDECVFNLLSALDSPRALTVWLMYSNDEHDGLVSLEIDPLWYESPHRFRDDYVATNLLARSVFLKTSFNKETVAVEKFLKFEEQCRSTNSRFKDLSFDPLYKGPNVYLLNAAIRKIERILGGYSSEEFVDACDWGPGVSTLLKGAEVSAFNKFHSENGITRDLCSLVSHWFPVAYPAWARLFTPEVRPQESGFVFQVGNTVTAVPKTAKSDRIIAIEPGINLWFQMGVGEMIARRLRRVGCDLTDQTRNQRLAYESSKDGKLATVDFSSASDSIASAVVEELIPPRWFTLLDSCRSKFRVSGDSSIWWNKFSSMGNGFTFPLEALIFFAAATSCCEYLGLNQGSVSVYGDDVILPVAAYDLFSSFTTFLGFTVNASKSFSSGPFRESCGAHYYDGVDCKPLYLKDRLGKVAHVYRAANAVRRLSHRMGANLFCDRRLLPSWRFLFKCVPSSLRLRISEGYGDGGLISNFDEATPRRARDWVEGSFQTCILESGVTKSSSERAILLARLWGPSTQERNNRYVLRGRIRSKINSRVLVKRWYNLGPWA